VRLAAFGQGASDEHSAHPEAIWAGESEFIPNDVARRLDDARTIIVYDQWSARQLEPKRLLTGVKTTPSA
jgi:hypothetical protein